MVMAHCGTFQYSGVVPATGSCVDGWRLLDEAAANAPIRGNHLLDNRLVGLRPILSFANDMLVLTAVARDRAEAAAASLPVDPALVGVFEGSDVVHLVRTGTGDVAVSVLRAQRLVIAFGALTAVPLGDGITVQNEPVRGSASALRERWPTATKRRGTFFRTLSDTELRAKKAELMRKHRWVEVGVGGDVARLREAEDGVLDGYAISVLRTFQGGIPGTHECVAISRQATCDHRVARSCAGRVAVWNAGLIIDHW